MTGRSGGASAAGGPSRQGAEAVRHTDEIFEALGAGRPVSSEDGTIRLLRALVADVGLDAPAMFGSVARPQSPSQVPVHRDGAPARRSSQPAQPAQSAQRVQRPQPVRRIPLVRQDQPGRQGLQERQEQQAEPRIQRAAPRIQQAQPRIKESRDPLRCR